MKNKIFGINLSVVNQNQLFALTILIILNLNVINACYITNCPWGGKRSQPDNLLENTRQCRKCANGLGTCFGPKICCGPDIGCLMDSRETNVCLFEDVKSRIPCSPYGKLCDKVEFGRCATSSLCCNPQHCLEDVNCSNDGSQENVENYDVDEQEVDEKLLNALKNLISKKKQAKLGESKKNYQPKFENDK